MRRLIIAGICSIGLFLLPSCGKEENETMPVSDEGLLSGPPPSQSEGTFILSAHGGNGSKTSGGAGGGIDVTPKAVPANQGDGDMTRPFVSSSVPFQVFTVECIEAGGFGEARFSVEGSLLGNIGEAISDLEFVDSQNRVRFTITTFGDNWAVGDKFTFQGPPLLKLNGANARLIKAGSVDTDFTVPFEPEDLGSNPRTISTDTPINLVDEPPFCPPIHDINVLGDDGASPATGLKVLPGATLTIKPAPECGTIASIAFEKDIIIEGTLITTITTAPNRADLSLTTNRNLIVRSSGSITTKGDSNSSDPGGHGRNISLVAPSGKVIFEGTLDSSGGDGTAGGDGGSVSITAGFDLYSTGAVTTNGGVASAGNGGDGGALSLTGNRNILNSGSLTANGGDGNETAPVGVTSSGGDGGAILITLTNPTEEDSIQIAAVISANGGNGTIGGSGSPSITINAGVGDLHLLNFNSLDLAGGDGKTQGGAGGSLTLSSDGTLFNELTITASGGDGTGTVSGVGGPGGSVTLSNSAFLINYGALIVNGGDGDNAGGSGGSVVFSSAAGDLGKVLNTADLSVNGGTASDVTSNIEHGIGGAGGEILFTGVNLAANQGALSANGGDATKTGGDGGRIEIQASSQTENSGDLSANGGNARVEDPEVPVSWTLNGGDGGVIVLATQAQPTTNSATLSVIKGTGSADSTAVHGRIFIDGTDVTPSEGVIQP